MRLVDVMLSIPGIILLILISALFHVGPVQLALVIAALGWFGLSRLLRSEILSIRRREYVEAARVIGAPDRVIIRRHILPNVTHLIIVFATGAAPAFILTEAALSYPRPRHPAADALLGQYAHERTAVYLQVEGARLHPRLLHLDHRALAHHRRLRPARRARPAAEQVGEPHPRPLSIAMERRPEATASSLAPRNLPRVLESRRLHRQGRAVAEGVRGDHFRHDEDRIARLHRVRRRGIRARRACRR